MAKYSEQLQNIWHLYAEEHGMVPSTLREALQWGVSRGMVKVPPVDPLAKLIEDMSSALREEYATDDSGRRYRCGADARACWPVS